MICVTWLLLFNGIYLGGLCALWVLHGSIYLSVKLEYVSFPIALFDAYMCILLILDIRNLCSVVGLCSSRFD